MATRKFLELPEPGHKIIANVHDCPKDGVRFVRGTLFSVALCLPFWMLLAWAIIHVF
jgi:hypothetical protein